MTRLTKITLIILFGLSLGACSSMFSSEGDSDASQRGPISDEELALSAPQFGDGNIPRAQADGLFADIHFDYNSSAVPENSKEDLKRNAEFLISDPSLNAELEGHCDKRGTNEYNLALGEERARSVARALVAYGVDASRLTTVSYGEEIPIDPGESEQAYAKNRRVHFNLYRPSARAGR